jgi:hypothetical protein
LEISDKRVYFTALIGAGVSLFMFKSGIFSFFFLVPLGFLSYKYDFRIAWVASITAILGNFILTAGTALMRGFTVSDTMWSFLYFTIMVLIFAWITSAGTLGRMPDSMRLMSGSCLASLFITVFFFRVVASPGFLEYTEYFLNNLLSIYPSGSSPVRNAFFESFSAEMVLTTIKAIVLRGGSLVSCVLLFSICRQTSLFLARLFAGKRNTTNTRGKRPFGINSLVDYHVPYNAIWVFSSSLILVVLARIVKLEIPEIILWNILVFCAILYFAQGLGIQQFYFARLSPLPRFILGVLFVFLLFSPFLNAILLTGLVLLGTAENWVPFRMPKGSSTPEDR